MRSPWIARLAMAFFMLCGVARADFSIPLTDDQGGWSLIGIPAQIGTFSPATQAYTYKGNAVSVSGSTIPGQGLWIMPAPGQTSLSVSGILTTTSQVYKVVLAKGWNLIANPFGSTIKWGNNINIQGPDQTIRPLSSAGDWVLPTAFSVQQENVTQIHAGTTGAKLSAFKGYWFYARENATIHFSFEAPDGSSTDPNQPKILSVNPASAGWGEDIVVSAETFNPQDFILTLGGTPLVSLEVTSGSIKVRIPTGSVTGDLRLTSNGETSEPVVFVVLDEHEEGPGGVANAGPPTINLLNPTSGNPYTVVRIQGAEFGATISENAVTVGGQTAEVLSASLTELLIRIPPALPPGVAMVEVSTSFGPSNSESFTVGNTTPIVTSISSNMGPVGTEITVQGSGFSLEPLDNLVYLEGQLLPVDDLTPTSFTTTIVAGATTGPISVALGSISASNQPVFTVQPLLQSIDPAGTLVWDQEVTLIGSGFNPLVGQNQVYFSNSLALVTAATGTELSVEVPFGVGDGAIEVVVNGISASGTISYSIGPSITGISPTLPIGGQTLDITGERFGTNIGAITVKLGLVNLFPTALTSSAGIDTLTVNVPLGVNTGDLVVTVAGVASNIFPVSVKPSILSVTPRLLKVGDTITVRGVGFSSVSGPSWVVFDAVPPGMTHTASFALPNSVTVTPTEIKAVIPEEIASGFVSVAVGNLSNKSDGLWVQIQPEITGSNILSGTVGESLSLLGKGFGTTLSGGVEVFWNGVSVPYSASSPTHISLSVPLGTYTGQVQIRNGGSLGAFSAPYSFSVIPFVANISPSQAPANSVITILGSGFSPGKTEVCFGGDTCAACFGGTGIKGTITAMTSLDIRSQAPSGFSRGKVFVRTGGNLCSQDDVGTFTAGPVVTGFSANYTDSVLIAPIKPLIRAGTTITVTGQGFAPVAADNTIWLNKTPVTPTSATTTTLQATVPAGVDSNLNQTARDVLVSTYDTVFGINGATQVGNNVSPAHVSASFYTTVGLEKFLGDTANGQIESGANLGIYVTGLKTTGGVTFNVNGRPWTQVGGVGTDTSAAANPINFTYSYAINDEGRHAGPYTYSVYTPTPAGYYEEHVILTGSLSLKPVITSLGSPGPFIFSDTVVINGRGFNNGIANMTVVCDNANGHVTGASFTSVTFRVPDGCSTGNLSVVTAYQGATGTSDPFPITIRPSLLAIDPPVAGLNRDVKITGYGFGKLPGTNQVSIGGVEATVLAEQPTGIELTVRVPSTLTPGIYPLVISSNNLSSSSLAISVTPTIDIISPSAAVVGDTIELIGYGYNGTPASNTVTFSGTAGTVTSVSGSTSLMVTVPSGAVTGPLFITTAGQTSPSVPEQILTVAPRLSGSSVLDGNVGNTVQITGFGFSPIPAENTVRIGATNAAVVSSSATFVGFVIPVVPQTGPLSLSVFTKNTESINQIPFEILPRITSLSPPSGGVGSVITVNGKGFDAITPANNTIKFGTVTFPATSSNATSVTFTVPAGLQTGPVSVIRGGLESNAITFQIAVTVSSINPNVAGGGEIIQILGNGFSGTPGLNTVTIAGVNATVLSSDFSTITAVVPNGIVVGATTLSVTVNSATSSPMAFTIRPTLNSVAPSAARVGDWITLAGSSFDPVPGNNIVRFVDSSTGPIATVSASSTTVNLIVQVPAGADFGPIFVTVNGQTSNPSYFTPIPKIDSFSILGLGTSQVAIGERLEINGSGFSTVMVDNITRLAGNALVLSSSTQTMIEVVIPSTATSGNVTVERNSQLSNALGITIRPTVLSIAPASASVGNDIVLTGGGFSTTAANNLVTFGGGATAVPSAATLNSLTVTVPPGAVTGTLTVSTSSVLSPPVVFTVNP